MNTTKAEPSRLCIVKNLTKRFRPAYGRDWSVSDIQRLLSDIGDALADLEVEDLPRLSYGDVRAIARVLVSAGEDLQQAAGDIEDWCETVEESLPPAPETPIDRADQEYAAKFPWRLQATA